MASSTSRCRLSNVSGEVPPKPANSPATFHCTWESGLSDIWPRHSAKRPAGLPPRSSSLRASSKHWGNNIIRPELDAGKQYIISPPTISYLDVAGGDGAKGAQQGQQRNTGTVRQLTEECGLRGHLLRVQLVPPRTVSGRLAKPLAAERGELHRRVLPDQMHPEPQRQTFSTYLKISLKKYLTHSPSR
eukprot:SAG31_NODE_3814_length_3859_cov_5.598936_6_plen_188_part_00